jgi:hypothetical protein
MKLDWSLFSAFQEDWEYRASPSSSWVTKKVIFDRRYVEDLGVQTEVLSLECDFIPSKDGEFRELGSSTVYKIREIKPDNHGGSTVILKEKP